MSIEIFKDFQKEYKNRRARKIKKNSQVMRGDKKVGIHSFPTFSPTTLPFLPLSCPEVRMMMKMMNDDDDLFLPQF